MTSISPEFQSLLQDLLETASEATKREQILRALAFSDMYGRFENVEPAHLETFEWIFNETYNDHVEDAKPHDDVEDTKPEDHIEDTGPVDQSNDREGSPDGGPEAEVSCPEAEDGYQDVEDDDQDVEDGGSEAEVGSLVAEDGYQDVEDDDQDAKDDDQDAEDTEDNSKPTSNFLDSGDAEPDLDSKTLLGDVEHDSSVREPFLHWLSFGNGIFHISGKLGSGKSTLMKFLCEHERTIAELQKWAGMYPVADQGFLINLYHTFTRRPGVLTLRLIRSKEAGICPILLLETRIRASKVTWRPLPMPSSRCAPALPRTHSQCLSGPVEQGVNVIHAGSS